MLGGLIFIYFVGKLFHDLAERHKRNGWGFGAIGVATYYTGIILGEFIIIIIGDLISPGFVDNTSDRALSAMGIPFGFLSCWITYTLLKRSWTRPKEVSRETLDADLMNTNANRYIQNER